ncbi:MAG: Mth938-like domain-containing protein, partial [Alphaproteobacteria bacterium]
MDITPHIRESRVVVDGYGDGGFRINGERREGGLIVLETEALSIPAVSMDDLTPAVLQPLVDRADALDVVIFGTGARMAFLPPEVMELLDRHR